MVPGVPKLGKDLASKACCRVQATDTVGYLSSNKVPFCSLGSIWRRPRQLGFKKVNDAAQFETQQSSYHQDVRVRDYLCVVSIEYFCLDFRALFQLHADPKDESELRGQKICVLLRA